MKIGILSNLFYPVLRGGGEKRYWEIAKRLVQEQHQVDVYTVQWPGLKKKERKEGITIYRVGPITDPLYDPNTGKRTITPAVRFAWKILHTHQLQRYDILETSTFPFFHCFPAKLHAMVSQTPLVFTIHEVWQGEWKQYMNSVLKGSIGIAIENFTAQLPDHIITVSDNTKKQVAQQLGIKKQKLSCISNGVELALAQKVKEQTTKETKTIVYAGRLAEHKKVELLLQAMPKVLTTHPKAKLEIVGGGPEEKKLRQLTKKLGLEQTVTIHGFLESYQEVLEIIAKGTMFVLPSIREGQGIVLLEAMSVGTPTIAVNYPGSGVQNVIRHKENGLLVKPLSSKALAKGIQIYLENKPLYNKILRTANEEIKQYDWKNITKEILHVYQQLQEK